MSWKTPGFPHRGWKLLDVHDYEKPCEPCQACGKMLRYGHVISHPEHVQIVVGCNCAEKLTEDYVTPKFRESQVKERSARRKRWTQRGWKWSAKGNPYLPIAGGVVTVFPNRRQPGQFSYVINRDDRPTYSPRPYPSIVEAQFAVFDSLYPPLRA